jgi:hypothetical protein
MLVHLCSTVVLPIGATFSPSSILGGATQSYYPRELPANTRNLEGLGQQFLDKSMMEKVTEVVVGILRTTTGSKRTHGKIRVEKQRRIKSVRSMTGLVTIIFLFYSIGCFLSC